jgi:hypothetical protein
MDYKSYIRPIIAGLVGLGLVILVLVLIVRLFTGHKVAPSAQVDVTQYANTQAVSTLVMQGPTVLDQNFRQVKITIGRDTNEIDLIQGYEGHVIKSQTYQNNSTAYDAFLQSLKLQGFSRGLNKDLGDYRGVCPFGSRYLYKFNDGNTDVFNYWSTSCGSQGTFKGSAANVRRLFVAQIPSHDFTEFINGTSITF